MTQQNNEHETAAIWLPITELSEWKENPRFNNNAIGPVAESIKRFGFGAPILARENGEIIAGHTRYHAALKLGLDRVPVRYMEGLDPVQAKLLALADNKLGEIAAWDTSKLAEILTELKDENLDGIGFSDEELSMYQSSITEDIGETWKEFDENIADDAPDLTKITCPFCSKDFEI